LFQHAPFFKKNAFSARRNEKSPWSLLFTQFFDCVKIKNIKLFIGGIFYVEIFIGLFHWLMAKPFEIKW